MTLDMSVADPGRGGGGAAGVYPPPPLPAKPVMTSYGTHDNTERVNGATILPIVVGGVIVINVPAHRM